MANTYTQLHIHIIFSTANRQKFLPTSHREEVEKFMTGIVTNLQQKLLAIYCMPDHAHLLIGLRPDIALSEVVQKVKTNSSRFINKKNWMKYKFAWQKGFGAFSYSKSQVPTVISYILNQEEHHRHQSFAEEYLELLKKFDVDYDERYVIDPLIAR